MIYAQGRERNPVKVYVEKSDEAIGFWCVGVLGWDWREVCLCSDLDYCGRMGGVDRKVGMKLNQSSGECQARREFNEVRGGEGCMKVLESVRGT